MFGYTRVHVRYMHVENFLNFIKLCHLISDLNRSIWSNIQKSIVVLYRSDTCQKVPKIWARRNKNCKRYN
jgi:hypothetical protein